MGEGALIANLKAQVKELESIKVAKIMGMLNEDGHYSWKTSQEILRELISISKSDIQVELMSTREELRQENHELYGRIASLTNENEYLRARMKQ